SWPPSITVCRCGATAGRAERGVHESTADGAAAVGVLCVRVGELASQCGVRSSIRSHMASRSRRRIRGAAGSLYSRKHLLGWCLVGMDSSAVFLLETLEVDASVFAADPAWSCSFLGNRRH